MAVVGGAGTWGRHYLRTYAQHPRCQVIALVDRARDRRQAFADHYGVPAVFDNVEELLEREVPDIVSAILPVAYTAGVVLSCAEAGVKVVSCEKPIAAQLSQADELVRRCRELGTILGCGTARWSPPYVPQTIDWIRAGNIGPLTEVAMPNGLEREVSGGACHDLVLMRLLAGREVEWVEGWTLPPLPTFANPEAADDTEVDCPAYGLLGLSGGIVCEVPPPNPDRRAPCQVSLTGEEGQVWICHPRPVLVQGKGTSSTPVFPDFLDEPPPQDFFIPLIEDLMRAFDTGEDSRCSGHDYRQVLEIAIALKQSAYRKHQRIALPLADRSLRLFPHPYRLRGGDLAGWESIGYTGPPQVA
ncbi:MAG: Gfo/Idh/MocA family oxidoreductase [Candidatus Latescibacteria bacterium]|nr:Gfo/Idh/MocA family oxidoreductase [Candidatus Latescibacterota bacterium]